MQTAHQATDVQHLPPLGQPGSAIGPPGERIPVVSSSNAPCHSPLVLANWLIARAAAGYFPPPPPVGEADCWNLATYSCECKRKCVNLFPPRLILPQPFIADRGFS